MKASVRLTLGLVIVVAVAVVGAFILLRPTSVPTSTYFEQPSSAGLSGLGAIGERFYVGLIQLDVPATDTVRFLGVDGLPASADSLIVRLRDTDAAIGVLQESAMDHIDAYKPLAGA